jgi:hypothetical protein
VSDNREFLRDRRAQAVFKHGILSRYPPVFAFLDPLGTALDRDQFVGNLLCRRGGST